VAACISNRGCQHAFLVAELRLHSPESAGSETCQLCVGGPGRRAFNSC
jgi:hypothetical protein